MPILTLLESWAPDGVFGRAAFFPHVFGFESCVCHEYQTVLPFIGGNAGRPNRYPLIKWPEISAVGGKCRKARKKTLLDHG